MTTYLLVADALTQRRDAPRDRRTDHGRSVIFIEHEGKRIVVACGAGGGDVRATRRCRRRVLEHPFDLGGEELIKDDSFPSRLQDRRVDAPGTPASSASSTVTVPASFRLLEADYLRDARASMSRVDSDAWAFAAPQENAVGARGDRASPARGRDGDADRRPDAAGSRADERRPASVRGRDPHRGMDPGGDVGRAPHARERRAKRSSSTRATPA